MTDNDNRDWDEELEDLVAELGLPDEPLLGGLESLVEEISEIEEIAEKSVEELLEERTSDLQRLQAEYVNYKRRVDRDRDIARQRGIEAVLVDLFPMLDGIDAAKALGELDGGAAMLADEVAKVATKYGLVSYGEEGDPFNPHIHEALMHLDKPGYAVDSVAQVFQRGYMIGERVVRPARVGVADADESASVPDESETGPDEGASDE